MGLWVYVATMTRMTPELMKLFEETRRAVAEERTRLFEQRRGKFKSNASRKRYYDNQLKQITVIEIGGTKR